MKVGTKSLLFGVHAFWLHPFFVAEAWRRLYGFPWDPRMWIAFLVHDWGYWGAPNMDEAHGKNHPILGATIMQKLFDRGADDPRKWRDFVLFHSRHMAYVCSAPESPLCAADKLAMSLTPAWLYIPMAKLTGELREYMANGKVQADDLKHALTIRERNMMRSDSPREWHAGLGSFMRRWAFTHRYRGEL